MAVYLGIDTSNYTTSTALYDAETNTVVQCKKLLPVREGQIGLRQSDAVFAHVKALGGLLEELFFVSHGISAVGVSVTPRDVEGSYMPCFLAGEMAARSIAAALAVPLYTFSHQSGHIAAALYATDNLPLLREEFIAFHISGGTTECLRIGPGGDRIFSVERIAHSLDLNAGQAVDRVGALLGLAFPAGPALETLALEAEPVPLPKPVFKGADCCLSGLENQCAAKLSQGRSPAEVARYCLSYLSAVILHMTEQARSAFPALPLVFAGGVMANSLIREAVSSRYDNCFFAPPAFSADNAAGIAVLSAAKEDASSCLFEKRKEAKENRS